MDTMTRLTRSEQRRRARLVKQAREMVERAGGHSTEEYRAAASAWVRGEITLEELTERTQH